MCGTFSVRRDGRVVREDVESELRVPVKLREDLPGLPVGTLHPGSIGWIVGGEECFEMEQASWGLVPAWARDLSIARHTFNARAETIREKPAFREAFRGGRCVVPSLGWWEWDARKRKVFVQAEEGKPFLFAGLRSRGTFTIVTRPASPGLAALHHREPLVVSSASARLWLDSGTREDALMEVVHREEPLAWVLRREPPPPTAQFSLELD